ncbi:hypothetical protein CBR_g31709 [Chara braunii]|uniref:Right handed beta helix domain-containing protein n=1 Tax=Chara braunii TaxID=69332 RepID=A0A388JY66_CHABU|nr:hypothetical protein CBR_g31709 [Chara braunii]|eukprot:GBG62692.1 hypothetical protein CBR_g31709 [Chara braunii]
MAAARMYVIVIACLMSLSHQQAESAPWRSRGVHRRSMQAQSDEASLRAALLNPNVTSFDLTRNITLTASLPYRGSSFTLNGKCAGSRCVISGVKRFSCFRGIGSWTFSQVIIQECRSTNRSLADAGGAAINIGNGISSGSLRVSDSIIRWNTASFRGGGVGVWSGRLNIERCDFIENAAQFGGAVSLNTFGRAYLTGSNFLRNRAGNAGGAIFSFEGTVNETTNCRFEGNTAGRTGGAIELQMSYAYTATLAKCTFIGNRAGLAGGAVNVADFHVEKRFCSVTWQNNTIGTGAVNHVSVGPSDLSITTGVYFCPDVPQGITVIETRFGPYIKTLCSGCPA